MSRKRRWKDYQYTNSQHMRTGLMRCCVCGKHIEGDYRYYETVNDIKLYHRECCPMDPQWSIQDAAKMARERRYQEYVQACKEFYQKWEVTDFTDVIDELEAENAFQS